MNRLRTYTIDSALGQHFAGWALGTIHSAPIIIMYHGVTVHVEPATFRNIDQKHIPLSAFVSHLKALKRWRRVIPLSELVAGLRDGADLKNTIAITFDDGYENNFLYAAPALADFNMPATFFVTTGFIGTEMLMWTDQLEIALGRTRESSVLLPNGTQRLSLKCKAEKEAALRAIKTTLKKLPHSECLGAVAALSEELRVAVTGAPMDSDYRLMNWEQTRSLDRAGFDVGAHTINHPILSQISLADAKEEILGSKDKIISEIGRCSSTFSFPNGMYSPALIDFCKIEFDAAVSANRGHALVDELYELRRFGTPTGARASNIEWMLLRER